MKSMEKQKELEGMYQRYYDDLKKALSGAKPFAGLFGFGSGPKDDPCHMRLIEDVKTYVSGLAEQNPTVEDAKAVVTYILTEQKNVDKDSLGYWTLMAAHGAALPLIGRLSREDALTLAEEYGRLVPKRERMPMQDQVLKALKRRGA